MSAVLNSTSEQTGCRAITNQLHAERAASHRLGCAHPKNPARCIEGGEESVEAQTRETRPAGRPTMASRGSSTVRPRVAIKTLRPHDLTDQQPSLSWLSGRQAAQAWREAGCWGGETPNGGSPPGLEPLLASSSWLAQVVQGPGSASSGSRPGSIGAQLDRVRLLRPQAQGLQRRLRLGSLGLGLRVWLGSGPNRWA